MLSKTTVVKRTQAFVKERFEGEGTGHDYWHMERVWRLAQHIAKSEAGGADMFIVELAALLHDIADWKFHKDPEAGPKAARQWLESLEVEERAIVHVEDIIRNLSFKGANHQNDLQTIEGKIVHDADKLDAMGAIGIARTFVYGGAKGRAMHDPDVPIDLQPTPESFKNSDAPTINHFYEKLLLLKDRMFTKTGRQLAEQRHEFMEKYLAEFFAEWAGKL